MLKCSKITVENKGAYVFNFSIRWLDADTGKWETSEWNSGNFPVLQSKTTPELSEIGVPANACAVTPYGHAVAGSSGDGDTNVQYQADTGTAVYHAVGTTFIGFGIELQD